MITKNILVQVGFGSDSSYTKIFKRFGYLTSFSLDSVQIFKLYMVRFLRP